MLCDKCQAYEPFKGEKAMRVHFFSFKESDWNDMLFSGSIFYEWVLTNNQRVLVVHKVQFDQQGNANVQKITSQTGYYDYLVDRAKAACNFDFHTP